MPVGTSGAVERIHRQVQDAVGHCVVLQYDFVDGGLVELAVERARGHEVFRRKVALPDHEEVHEDKGADEQRGRAAAGEGRLAARRRLLVEALLRPLRDHVAPHYQQESRRNQQQRAQRVGTEQIAPVGLEGLDEYVLLPFIHAAGERPGERRDQQHQQAESARYQIGGKALLPECKGIHLPFQDAVKRQESKHRQSRLKDYQGHGHRPELVVERQMVVEELGEPHQMASQRQQDGQQGADDHPPLILRPAQEKPKDEEEYRNGAHVHRPRRERLRAPVQRQRLGNLLIIRISGLLEQLSGLRMLRVYGSAGRTAVEVRDHEVRKLLPAVGPCRGVV